MTLYSLILFIHVTAVLVLSAALSFEVLSLFHLRRASSWAEAHPWMEPVPRLHLFTVGSALSILFSGVYLVIRRSAFDQGWPMVTVAALLLIAPLGAMTGRRMRAIREAYTVEKVINSEWLGRLRDPFLKISLGIRIAVFLGILLLMNAQPGLWESISIVAASAVLGLVASLLASRRGFSMPVPSAGHGDY